MKNKIITISFIIYISFFSILSIILKDNDISYTERRKLNTLPKFQFTSEYITKLDKYFLDHFPLRDDFRSIKANYNYHIYLKHDNNGIYLKDNYIFKSNYPTNHKSINNFINNVNTLSNMYTKSNKFIMIIPDKNYYLNDNNFLHIDYNYIYDEIDNLNIETIDLRNVLELNDYYETDTHWKQENLEKVINYMSTKMKFNYVKEKYKKNTFNNFYGVYYSESAIKREPEKLTYLTNELLDNIKVEYLENEDLNKVYNIKKLESMDAYEVYLDGASSYIEITNDKSIYDKELIIFRDSFGSSISPLLVNYYKKIIIIDNRYIKSDVFNNYIDYNNQDIIFMYSTLLVNNSFSLKG